MEINEKNKKLFEKTYEKELDMWKKNCPSLTEKEQEGRARGRALLAVLSNALTTKKYIFTDQYLTLKEDDIKLYDVLITKHWLTSEIEHPMVVVDYVSEPDKVITTQRPTVDMFNYIEYDIEL